MGSLEAWLKCLRNLQGLLAACEVGLGQAWVGLDPGLAIVRTWAGLDWIGLGLGLGLGLGCRWGLWTLGLDG
jgi:hypothetical protein